jgi:ArsR family transcriptional regulator
VLEKARERAQREGEKNVSFLCEDLHHLSVADGSMDLVVISQSLHHVEKPEAVLAEAFRIVKKGGRLVLLELMPHDQRWVSERLGHRHLGFDPDAVRASLEKVGFTKVKLTTHARDGVSPFRVFLLTGEKL